ncbi:MAG: fucose isomerase [Armatimonadetes bacterium]|nr:fucose isomerase [Armatimonadota bacterium]
MASTIYLVASGDLRLAANQNCEAAQAAMEQQIVAVVEREGHSIQRAHPIDPEKGHGFIDSQRYGIEVFRSIPDDAPLILAKAVWQYSHHVLAGLFTHKGPILTLANWSGMWPGLVGLLNLNASLTKAGVNYSTLWSEDFSDEFFAKGLRQWLRKGRVKHDTSHVRRFDADEAPKKAVNIGRAFAKGLRKQKAIMGIFDEGCMGMYNAIIPDELLHPTGVFKERLSQSTLYARMLTVADSEARGVYDWLRQRGVQFQLGTDEATELTERQVLEQCKMYIAAVRIADEFGCDTIGIQYQQGLKDLTPASDLAEGILNNSERPPVYREGTTEELFPGEAVVHFNEVDECAGLDALVTYRLWRQLGFPPETTLHDLRWGRYYKGNGVNDFVWVLEISGAAPPAHFIGGYAGASSQRQPPMYFRLGGGSLKGISKPGWVVWSRVFVANGRLNFDTGLAEVVELPEEETEERWRLTTSQWPIMHAVIQGVSRDQMMARHKSNHIQVAYAPSRAAARTGMFVKAAAMEELGLRVSICGV